MCRGTSNEWDLRPTAWTRVLVLSDNANSDEARGLAARSHRGLRNQDIVDSKNILRFCVSAQLIADRVPDVVRM